jgi:hypothetical protein
MTFLSPEARWVPGLALRKVPDVEARLVAAGNIRSQERLTLNFRADYAPARCWPSAGT